MSARHATGDFGLRTSRERKGTPLVFTRWHWPWVMALIVGGQCEYYRVFEMLMIRRLSSEIYGNELHDYVLSLFDARE